MKVYNTTDSGVTVDDDGHQIDGYTSSEVTETRQVKQAIDAGALIEVEDPAQDNATTDTPDAGQGEKSVARTTKEK